MRDKICNPMAPERVRAVAIVKDRNGMNKTEAAFFEDQIVGNEKIVKWYFERVRLVLGKACTYTPDFLCLMRTGELVAYEVKGWWRDDARVKFKVAADAFPWIRFIAVQQRKKSEWAASGRWKEEEI